MQLFLKLVLQILLFLAFGAAYADLALKFTPFYTFNIDPNVREIVLLSCAVILSICSVHLLKSVFGFALK